jgi:hypothetical protein
VNDAPDYRPSRWWRVIAPDGSVWCETSDEAEARESKRPDDRLYRLYMRTATEWVQEQ